MREHNYYIYIVRCFDTRYYTGVTNNVERRVREHNEGKEPKAYTFNRRPVELVFTAHFEYIYDAIHWEKIIKGWSRKKKEALINGDRESLKLYAKRRGGKPKEATHLSH